MSLDEVHVGHEQVRQMASTLRSSTDELGEAAKDAPDMPEVSTSAEQMSRTLSELSQAAAGLGAAIDEVADKINASEGSYGEVDNQSAEQLQRESYDAHSGRAD